MGDASQTGRELHGAGGTATLAVSPARSRVDEPLSIVVNDATPRATLTLRASTRDGSLTTWRSTATFVADDDGRVDTSTDAPSDGSYGGIDQIGLLWSMQPVDGRRPRFFAKRLPTPLEVHVELLGTDGTLDSVGVVRHFGDHIRHRDAPRPVVGRLFSGGQPAPGVVVLPGSDGGSYDHAASLLAADGFTALSLAVFGVEDRPPTLTHIDIAYVLDAIAWLRDQPEVGGGRVGIIGLSRGGELALQTGALSDAVGAVVAGAPSNVRHAGLTDTYTDFTQPAWTLDGEPLDFIKGAMTARTFLSFLRAMVLRRPMRQREMFERLTADTDATAPAEIEVERIDGPVLLISGSDDQLWPSSVFAERVLRRRGDTDHDDRHLKLADAGHFVSAPYALPTLPPMTQLSPPGPISIDFGGTAEANARAAWKTWHETLAFLEHLRDA